MADFLPPHDLNAEQAVLGGLMLNDDEERRAAVMAMLKPESFYSKAHERIYRGLQALAKTDRPTDAVTLSAELTASGDIELVGGFGYLVEICRVPAAANTLAYARIVRDNAIARYTQRQLIACTEIIMTGDGQPVDEKLVSIQRIMGQTFEHATSGKRGGLRPFADVLDEWMDDVDRRYTDPTAGGLTLGFDELDEIMAPKNVLRGAMVVVGARPKMGKTAFYNRVLGHFALNHKLPTLAFSLEVTARGIVERLISQEAGVKSEIFYTGAVDEMDMARAMAKAQELAETNLMLDDTPSISLAHIVNECRRVKRQRGVIGLVAVDYLTLMRGEQAERRDLSYGEITKGLKALAKELDCVVLLLTQLNRALEQRADKRPLPSDSRDTGQIEQDCDVWIGVYRDAVYNENSDPQLTELLLRMNREGATGTAHTLLRDGYFVDTTPEDIAQRKSQAAAPQRERRYSKKEPIQPF
ncbi:replicative DNA helicase [Dickeya undicola]|uniref:DNA 5'-3' helicase n=1 Tax=Dickeya undicola TaxID=1577887 RepID=A0A3N0G5N4_9GAMM|nr:DnaB-like helicase C-terminal domain-containing protein [Dickeya undicola]RNM07729.1 helicase DnaB [Dickeya undicola]